MNRKVPLKRNATPVGGYRAFRRKSPIKRKAARRIARETADDKRWKQWIHTRPCVGILAFSYTHHRCSGEVQQSHERSMTGLGLKAPNRRSVPMCSDLHRQWETHAGVFTGKTKEQRKAWLDPLIEQENAAFERMDSTACNSPGCSETSTVETPFGFRCRDHIPRVPF